MSEDTPVSREYPGPTCADADEVSETPALIGSGRTATDANPQETELFSTEISPTPPAAVDQSSQLQPVSVVLTLRTSASRCAAGVSIISAFARDSLAWPSSYPLSNVH